MGRRLVVEADGGSRGNPGPAAYGALVRDAVTGELLAETAQHIGRASNNVAEYRGAIAGLTAARDVDGGAEVEVRMDSKLVVEQMSGRWKIKHPDMRPLAAQAAGILPAAQVRWTWVPRARNSHADRLANEALDAAARGQGWVRRASPAAAVDEAEIEPAPANTIIGWDDLGAPTTLLLLRHGETAHTLEKRFSGLGGADPGLAPSGSAQAGDAAAALVARGGVDAVVSSPLRRTRETAAVVAAALGLAVRVEDGLAECAFGDWEGRTFAEVRAGWPAQLEAWLASTAVAPPGGESFDDVTGRVGRARDRVLARHPGRTVLAVTHVTPIKTLVRLALGAPPEALYRMELEPASISEIRFYPGGAASLRAFNTTSLAPA